MSVLPSHDATWPTPEAAGMAEPRQMVRAGLLGGLAGASSSGPLYRTSQARRMRGNAGHRMRCCTPPDNRFIKSR